MKTENFDDAIRGKIESINPQFDERDVDKAHNYVLRKRGNAFRLSNSNIVFASVCMVAIAALLIWNFSQKEERNQLVQTIDSLKKNIAQAESRTPVIKTDTVYQTKYINESVAAPSKNVAVSKQGDSNKGTPTIASSAIKNNRTSKNNGPDIAMNQKGNSENKNDSQAKEYIASKTASEENAHAGAVPAERKADAGPIVNPLSANVGNENNNKDQSSGIAGKVVKDSGVTKVITKSDSPVAYDDYVSKPPDSVPSDKDKHKSSSHFLKDLHYRVGVGYERGSGSFGYSIAGEVLLNNKWSISTGVELARMKNENYNNDNDFHYKKGTDFYHTYSSDIPDTSSFSNIEIHTTLIRIPVMINYRIALKHNFYLLFGAGTDLDVVAKQDVGYHHKDSNNPDNPKSFNSSTATLLINNVTLEAGIQKEWKHLVIQVSPFASPQITNVAYKKDNFSYGFGVKVLYAI